MLEFVQGFHGREGKRVYGNRWPSAERETSADDPCANKYRGFVSSNCMPDVRREREREREPVARRVVDSIKNINSFGK